MFICIKRPSHEDGFGLYSVTVNGDEASDSLDRLVTLIRDENGKKTKNTFTVYAMTSMCVKILGG